MGLRDLYNNPLDGIDTYSLFHQKAKINTDWEASIFYNRAEGMIKYGFDELVGIILNIQATDEHIWQIDKNAKRMGLKAPMDMLNRLIKECNGIPPLKVEAIPDGYWCPAGTPFAQIRNTVEGFGEMVTWFEPRLMKGWWGSTSATRAFHMHQYLRAKQEEYGYDDSFMWRFHNFGYRGHQTDESAYWYDTAMAIFLPGTDAFHVARHLPNATLGSIPALAHKVTQQFDNEMDCYFRAIDMAAEDEATRVAIPIDTYDADRYTADFLLTLTAYARKKNVILVNRPDSGDTFGQAVDIWHKKRASNIQNTAVIIGEGMSLDRMMKSDARFEAQGVALNFINYGYGGANYADMTRDTLGWALKTCYSNKADRMKFGMTRLKQSTPGFVDVDYNPKSGNMTIVPEFETDNSLYDTIFEYNGFGLPQYYPQTWDDIQTTALIQDGKQKVINISSEIDDKIQVFKQKYGGK